MATAIAEAPASYSLRHEPMDSMMAQQSMPSLNSMPTAIPFTAEMNDYDTRPDFIDAEDLRSKYNCPLCKDILINPQQTPCGGRACKVCLRNKFGQEETIKCPMPHDEEDDMEDGSLEECQRDGGLKKNDISPDSAVQRVLLKKKCHCRNRKYGCKDAPLWRKLPLHEHDCKYSPVRCSRGDCKVLFPEMEREHHDREVCRFVNVSCEFCKRVLLRGALDDHIDTCDKVNSSCESCRKDFGNLKRLRIHHQINPTCNKRTGKCHYYECCQFSSKNPNEMKAHLRDSLELYMEYVTMKSADLEVETKKTQETFKEEATGMLNKKVKPLEKAAANIYMEVKILQKKIDSSDTNSDHLVNAMNTVSNNSTQVESLTNKIGIIERQIKDSGLDRVMVIDSHSQNIRRHTDKLSDLETRMKLHEHDCKYSPVPCSRGDCKDLFPEMEREHHDKEVCRFVNVSCEFCHIVLLRGALKLHEHECEYAPVRCSRRDCRELFPEMERQHHDKEVCRFVSCQFCNRVLLREALDDHIETCDQVDSRCKACRKDFGNLEMMRFHHQISPTCSKRTGNCYFYECCRFSAESSEEIRAHLTDNPGSHTEYLTMEMKKYKDAVEYLTTKCSDLEMKLKKNQEKEDEYVDSDIQTLLNKMRQAIPVDEEGPRRKRVRKD